MTTWNMARARAQMYRPRKAYKPVDPIVPMVTAIASADPSLPSRYQVNGLTWCSAAEWESLTHRHSGDAEESEFDEVCQGCGYLRCSCKYTCGYCNEHVVFTTHDEVTCRAHMRARVIRTYVDRKEPIPEWVAPEAVVRILDEWARDAESYPPDGREWALRWRGVRRLKVVEPVGFVKSLNEFVELANQGKTHDELYQHFIQQDRARADADAQKCLELARAAQREQAAQFRFPIMNHVPVAHTKRIASGDTKFESDEVPF